jgi:serine/threonine-protein kinase
LSCKSGPDSIGPIEPWIVATDGFELVVVKENMSTVPKRTNSPNRPPVRVALGFVGAVGLRRVSAALAGRYTVLKQLAGSESAEFYLARPVSSGQGLVKVKVLSPRAACDVKKRELFRLEAAAASKLDHINIVRTSQAVEIDGIHICIIEHRPWVESLRDLLHRRGWLDLDHAASIINQIANAVSHAHKSNVLHLKLAPENILIEPNGHLLVTDFGIDAARELEWAHRERSHGFTASYMSVEQIIDQPLDHRSDVYALGLLLYEMLTDRVPFDSCDVESLKRQRANYSPLPPFILSTGVPPAVSDIVMNLLEREPAKRPSRADALQRALSGVLSATAESADNSTTTAAR